MAFSPNGRQLASCSCDKTVRLWDLSNGSYQVLEGFTNHVNSVAFSPDEKQLACGLNDNSVRLWNLVSDSCQVLEGHLNEVASVAFSPNGKQLVSNSHDGTVRIWDSVSGSNQIIGAEKGEFIYKIVLTPDGKHMACAYSCSRLIWNTTFEPGGLQIWDLESDMRRVLEKHEDNPIISMAFSHDGKQLAYCSALAPYDHQNDDKFILKIWSLQSVSEQVLEKSMYPFSSIAFGPDGKELAYSRRDNKESPFSFDPDEGTVRVRSLEKNTAQDLPIHHRKAQSVSYSPDGKYLATGFSNGTIQVWDLKTRSSSVAKVHSDRINNVNFSPSGKYFATASDDGTVLVCDTFNWSILKRYRMIKNVNLSGANFEQAIVPQEDKALLKEAGTKI